MAPEYGATIGVFPIDSVTLDYLLLRVGFHQGLIVPRDGWSGAGNPELR